MTFTIKCAWCTETLVEGPPGAPISHGICRPCSKAVAAHAEAAERIIDKYRDLKRNDAGRSVEV
jgi:hypothetical protein